MNEPVPVSEVQCPGGTFYIVPALRSGHIDVAKNYKLVGVMWQQSAKYHRRRLPLAHAMHLLAEYAVKPEFEAFP